LTLPVPAKPRITREGLAGVRPSRQARTWSHDGAQDGRDGVRRRRRRGRDDHRFASYYGKPIINLPVWKERDSDGLGVAPRAGRAASGCSRPAWPRRAIPGTPSSPSASA